MNTYKSPQRIAESAEEYI